MKMWPGQFIGFSPNSPFSTSVKYMFSRYASQCPDFFHTSTLKMIGVRTSW